jgi:GcrA cell cycle regulator
MGDGFYFAGDCLAAYTNPWLVERNVELLKQLYAEGHPASHIAARIGGVSRNAVIGKAHRLGLLGTAPAKLKRTMRQRSRAERTGKTKQRWRRLMTTRPNRVAELFDAEPVITQAEPEIFIPVGQRKTITQLADIGECKWPIGDPREPDFHFCAGKQVSGLPYCDFHARRAFQPPQPQQRRAAPAQPVSTHASHLEEVG